MLRKLVIVAPHEGLDICHPKWQLQILHNQRKVASWVSFLITFLLLAVACHYPFSPMVNT